jgi:APA family basic amino acid/polyamine antiporter
MSDMTGQRPVRRIGTWAAIAMVVSEVVGVGIFLTPATMTLQLGSLWAALLVWLAMAIVAGAGALCYTELATRFPHAGGAYVFLREGFGLRCAAVYGWMALLVMDPGLVAALAVGLSRYLIIVMGASRELALPLALTCIVGFGLLTLLGLQASARIMEWTAGIKLVVIAVLVLTAIARAAGAADHTAWPALASDAPRTDGLATATMAAFFAFGGWWELGRMSEEVESPRRTIPRALLGGVALVAVMYALVTVAFMLVVSAPAGASDEAFVWAVGAVVFGDAAAGILPAMVVVAVSGTLAAVLLRAPRSYLAMARDGVFPRRLARFDAERGTCAASTIVQTALACGLVLLGGFDDILGYFVPAAVFFLGLSSAAVLRVPRPAGDARLFSMPLYPLPLGLFLVSIAAVLAVFAIGHPTETLRGASLIALAFPIARFAIASPARTRSQFNPTADTARRQESLH